MAARKSLPPLRARSMLGKYRILRKIGSGGFADVYAARDTIEGVDVALKIPLRGLLAAEILEVFRHEVRITSALDHTNILALKNADFVEGRFVIANRLGAVVIGFELA